MKQIPFIITVLYISTDCIYLNSAQAASNLQLKINSSTNGTVILEAAWPASFTSSVEIFSTTNLMSGDWNLTFTNISTAHSSSFIWNEMGTHTRTRFYIAADANLDTDVDGLSDAREIFIYQTLWDIRDTDRDGLWDGFEIENGFNPRSLPGAGEVDADIDGDELPDPLERLFFGDLSQHPTNDWDGDRLLNQEEFGISLRHDDPCAIDSPWVQVPSNAATVAWGDRDEGFALLAIGFDFPFFGTIYSNLHAGVNGTCSFGGAYGAWNGVSLLPNGNANALTAPFWSDLEVIHGSVHCFSRTVDFIRSFIVTWENVSFYDLSASSLSFQAEFFEDGSLVFRYAEMDFAGASTAASIGIQGDSGTDGKSWGYSSDTIDDITNGLAVYFPPRVSTINLSSYPDATDSDNDGMDDKFESDSRLLNPLDPSDGSEDWDFDGLNNLLEYQNSTEIDLADTDGDGFSDGFEVAHGFDPTHPLDPDRAGLADADRDGIADIWEMQYFGNLMNTLEGDIDGDLLTNGEEYLAGTNPLKADTDGDGLADNVDSAPFNPGPKIALLRPRNNDVITSAPFPVEGTISFGGSLDSVKVGDQEAALTETDGYWNFYTTVDSLTEGHQTFTVTASGHRQGIKLDSKTELSICADIQPPKLKILSASDNTIVTNLFVHLTAQTDDTAPLFINGKKMARDGFLSYAWIELAPGDNAVEVMSADEHGRTSIQSIEVYCDVPYGYTENRPDDADSDGVLDAFDLAPNNPSSSGNISYSSHENGSMVAASMDSTALEEERTFLLRGRAAANSYLTISTHPVNTLRGCDRSYGVAVGSNGMFEQEIKLFPGPNEITTTCGMEINRQLIDFVIPVSPITFHARWGPAVLRMLSVLTWGPAPWIGGSMDTTWDDGELIYECPEPTAGSYICTMKTYRFKELWYRPLYQYDSVLPGGYASIDMIFGNKVIYSERTEFPYVWENRFNYHAETLDVALFQSGSVAFHFADNTAAYVVDENGQRDLAPQGTYIGQKGWSELYYDPDPSNGWPGDTITNYTSDLTLTGPEGTNSIVIPAGSSAQFQATGTFRKELGGAPDDKLCSIFTVGTLEGSAENAFIDASGVFTAMEKGHYQVKIKHNSILRESTEFYAADDIPPIDVFVIDPSCLIADTNRDGVIDDTDRLLSYSADPFRFWINDDDDFGDIAEDDSDVPGQGGLLDNANCDDGQVNGRCDLLDFFPVWLDLNDTLSVLPISEGTEYRLRHDDEAVRFVYTDLTVDEANAYRILEGNSYGPRFIQNAFEADTIKVTDSGIALNAGFLNRIASNSNKGVLMIEGIKASNQPLILEIWRDGTKLSESRLNLSLSGVEDMYRWINLRGVADGSENRPTDTREPLNFPDSSSNGKNFVFVHGYSVHEEAARAWNAEMFKRLYQSGSHAMFTAATWRGNDSQIWSWIPFVGGSTPDYYENVENAFATAPHLTAQLINLPGEKVIAGHSLGNMVVSSAIVDHGLDVEAYFMLNAAVAMEAYNETFLDQENMRHPDWQNYSNRLWSCKWHSLFSGSDSRSELTWGGRFKGVPSALNYFSSTEDVLANSNGNVPGLGRVQAWVCQEMRKGTTLMWIAPGNTEAGWGFNADYDVIVDYDPSSQPFYDRMPPPEANALPDSAIQTNSFFYPFDDEELYSDTGNTFLLDGELDVRTSVIYRRLLADAIPALSNPAGRNSLGNAVNDNIEFMQFKRGVFDEGGWPRSLDEWRHSDIKNVAYPFNHGVFDGMIIDGGLE